MFNYVIFYMPSTAAPLFRGFVIVFIDFEGFLFLDLLRSTIVWYLFFCSII